MTTALRGSASLETKFDIPISPSVVENDESIRVMLWEGFKQYVYFTDEPPAGFAATWVDSCE